MEIATMHDMSNTRKEIAARLGFAAGNCAKAEFGGMKGLGDWTVGFTDVMKERIAQLKQLAKSLKATVTLGRVSPNGMYSGTVSRKYGPMEPPDFTASTKVEQLIKSLGGYENDSWRYNARPGAKAAFGNADRLDSLMAAVYRALKNNDKASAKRLMADAAKEIDENTPSYILAEYKDLKKGMSRPGAKATMTREQTEEQKAGLKIMSAADPAVGAKIAKLIKEGKPQDQAVAIALDMKRRGEL